MTLRHSILYQAGEYRGTLGGLAHDTDNINTECMYAYDDSHYVYSSVYIYIMCNVIYNCLAHDTQIVSIHTVYVHMTIHIMCIHL